MDVEDGPAVPDVVRPDDAEALYEQAPCGYLTYAPDGTVVKVNATFLRWTGYGREEVVGRKRFVDLLTPGGRIYHETHYAPLLRMQHSVQEIAFTMVCADGRRLPVLVNSRLLLTAEGTESVTLTSVFNATDRRRYERELLAARREAEAATARLTLVRQVADSLAAAGDVAEVGAVLVDACRSAVGAEAAVLWLRSGSGRLMVAAAVSGVAEDLSTVADLPMSAPAARDEHILAGELVVVPVAQASARFPLATGALGGSGTGVLALAPLVDQGRLVGVLGCRFADRDAPDESHQSLLVTLVKQAGLAVPRAKMFEQQRDVAQTLQRSLLPAVLPQDPRFALATVYRPARDGPAVGGDWYDAFWLDGDHLAVVVGDVVGRGVHAAAAMGQLRSAIRAVASVSPHPVQVLEALDHFVDGVPAAASATMVYAVLDVPTGRLTYACAGHPPPVLLDASGAASLLWEGRSVPLGVRVTGEHRAAADVQLPAGSRLLLYTDGLVERRDAPLDVRIDALAEEVGRRSASPAHELVESVADTMLQNPQAPDDVCLLCLSVT